MTKPDLVFPTTLSRTKASLDREERRKKRLLAVETAMRSLPLRCGKDLQTRGLSGLFEQTFVAVRGQLERKIATTRKIERELFAFVKASDKIVDHIEGMHPDTLLWWASAGGTADAAINATTLYLMLKEASEWPDWA